jgi:NADPH:quinone reductase-like Zn-dependent oxidoreductase
MGDSARPRGTKVQLRRTTHVAVLIIGASGGLGTYAAQLGQVTGVCSTQEPEPWDPSVPS